MSRRPKITVAIVEDRETIRRALQLIVDGTPGMVCAAAFADAESILSVREFPEVDVVLLDIGLPGLSGIEAIAPIRARWSQVNVLVLTVHDDEDVIFDALCQGATGYLLKSSPPAEILEAIKDVQSGGAPMTASVARKVVHFFRRPKLADAALTVRENEVLQHIVEGRTNRQVAELLYISENTVAYHVKQIYEKLHVHSRAEAVARAMKGHHL